MMNVLLGMTTNIFTSVRSEKKCTFAASIRKSESGFFTRDGDVNKRFN